MKIPSFKFTMLNILLQNMAKRKHLFKSAKNKLCAKICSELLRIVREQLI